LALLQNPDYGCQHLFLFSGDPEVCILNLQGIRMILPIIAYEELVEKAFEK
jgi:hypothetical protein